MKMATTLYILADSNAMDVILWLIPIVIWIIGSIAAAGQKKKDRQKRERARIQTSAPPPLPRPAPPRPQRQQPPPRIQPHQPRPQPVSKRNPKRYANPQRRPLPQPSPRRDEVLTLEEARTVTAKPPVTPPPSKPVAKTSPSPAQTIQQLLRPQNLRSQLILMELLQPPIALREKKEN